MITLLFLQAIYNISEEALISELYDRLSLRNFLTIPRSYQIQRQSGITINYCQRLVKTKQNRKQY
ncbi:MAG: transposase [Thermoplasmata archaeon]